MFWTKLAGISLSCAMSIPSSALPANSPAYQKAGADAATHLAEYLRINTTNPPGNEKLGAEYLASILKKNDIEAEVIPADDKNRAFVYARLKGNGSKRPII